MFSSDKEKRKLIEEQIEKKRKWSFREIENCQDEMFVYPPLSMTDEKKKKKKINVVSNKFLTTFNSTKIFNLETHDEVLLPYQLHGKICQIGSGCFFYCSFFYYDQYLFLTTEGKLYSTYVEESNINQYIKGVEEIKFPGKGDVRIKRIFSNTLTVFVITENNEIYGWGCNGFGHILWKRQICNENLTLLTALKRDFKIEYQLDPIRYMGDRFWLRESMEIKDKVRVIHISFQFDTAIFFLLNIDKVYGVGYNGYGQIGLGHNRGSGYSIFERYIVDPMELTALTNMGTHKLVSSRYFSLALSKTGVVYSWGLNEFGYLARAEYNNGNICSHHESYYLPKKCDFAENVKIADIYACNYISLFLTQQTGEILACGLFAQEIHAIPTVIFKMSGFVRFLKCTVNREISIVAEHKNGKYYHSKIDDEFHAENFKWSMTHESWLRGKKVIDFTFFGVKTNFLLVTHTPSISFVIQLKRKDFLDIKFQYK